jgi:hypothetical protein
VSKQRRANRTRNKGDSKGRQRLQRGRRRIALREENMREDDDRGGGINIKSKNSMAVPISEATTTLLREFTGTFSVLSRVLWLLLA